jgi:hypothetical protein
VHVSESAKDATAPFARLFPTFACDPKVTCSRRSQDGSIFAKTGFPFPLRVQSLAVQLSQHFDQTPRSSEEIYRQHSRRAAPDDAK